MNIPEGYALVPVELTQEMIKAGIDTECVYTGDEVFDEKQDYRAVYKSFLESAPQFPAFDEDKDLEKLIAASKEILRIAGIANQGSNAYNRAIINLHETVESCAKSRARSAE